MDAYRTNAKQPFKRLPRLRALIRGLLRRIVAPVTIIATIAVGLSASLFIAWCGTKSDMMSHDADRTRHFRDWEKALEARQAAIDEAEKKQEPARQELERLLSTVKNAEANMQQLPVMVRGRYSEYPNDFHGYPVAPPDPHMTWDVMCYLERTFPDRRIDLRRDIKLSCTRYREHD